MTRFASFSVAAVVALAIGAAAHPAFSDAPASKGDAKAQAQAFLDLVQAARIEFDPFQVIMQAGGNVRQAGAKGFGLL